MLLKHKICLACGYANIRGNVKFVKLAIRPIFEAHVHVLISYHTILVLYHVKHKSYLG